MQSDQRLRLWRARLSSLRFLCLRIFLRRGLMIDPECGAIGAELRQLGVRHRPVLGFLRRQNALNRWFGLLRRRLRQEDSDLEPFRA